MPKPKHIELGNGESISILHEDRSVIALDKPRGWMLVPHSWQKTNRNLQAAITSSIAAGQFWARSRNLKFLRFIHRLDADTSGILLFARSHGALKTFTELFESRRMEKIYLAVVAGVPAQTEWTCRLQLAPDPRHIGKMKVDARLGKEAETRFRVLATHDGAVSKAQLCQPHRSGTSVGRASPRAGSSVTSPQETASPPQDTGPARTLIEAKPVTGRTHQIRVHLAQAGHPVLGDALYGKQKAMVIAPATQATDQNWPLALRAISLAYVDPFTQRRIHIRAPFEDFLREYGFAMSDVA